MNVRFFFHGLIFTNRTYFSFIYFYIVLFALPNQQKTQHALWTEKMMYYCKSKKWTKSTIQVQNGSQIPTFLFLKSTSIAGIIKMLFLAVWMISVFFFHLYNLLGTKEWLELIEISIVIKTFVI